ncbi:CBS domain-containing protein [Desulfosoma sp.]
MQEAINAMAAHRISSLIVMDKESPVGIFTERDVLKTLLKFRDKPSRPLP